MYRALPGQPVFEMVDSRSASEHAASSGNPLPSASMRPQTLHLGITNPLDPEVGAIRSRQAAVPPMATSPFISTRSFYLHEVLDRDWDTVQRANGMAGADGFVRGLGGETGVGRVD
jgi:hypothetical protein